MRIYTKNRELHNEFYGRAMATWYQATPVERLEIMKKANAEKFKTAKAKLGRCIDYIIITLYENKTI